MQKNVQTFKGHKYPITALKHSPDGHWVVTGDAGGCVKVWDLTTGLLLRDLTVATGSVDSSGNGLDEITALEFHPIEFWLAVAGGGGGTERQRCVSFWDMEDPNMINIANTAREATKIRSILWHNGYLFSGAYDTFKAWSWDPVQCHDAIDVGWKELTDLAATPSPHNDVFGLSVHRTDVSVYGIDISVTARSSLAASWCQPLAHPYAVLCFGCSTSRTGQE